MATPINSTNNAAAGASATNGVSPAISDLLTRFGVQAKGAQASQMAFSQWMDKHATSGGEQPAQPKPAAEGANQAGTSANANASAHAAEQALARSRQQALMANRSLEARQQAAAAEQARAQSHGPAKAKDTDKAEKADKADKADKTEEADKKAKSGDDEVTFNTAMGEGSAVVRELTPPPTIQPNDAAGMMAWLASLTHGEAGQGQTPDKGAGGLGQADGSQTGSLQQLGGDPRLQQGLIGADDGKGGKGASGAIVLDNALWQNASATADLQAEALLAQPGRSGEARGDVDPLAGLMAGGVKGAPTGPSLQDNAVRHESATLPTPLDAPDFAQALADKVSMWVGSTGPDGSMTAELHLNPADMGPINVKISLDGQTAQVDFAAAALETRQAIEASLPLLSSALNDVGLNMTGGDVSSQTAQQQFGQQFAQSQQGGGSGRSGGALRGDVDTGAEPVGMRAVAAPRPGRLGGLDLYA